VGGNGRLAPHVVERRDRTMGANGRLVPSTTTGGGGVRMGKTTKPSSTKPVVRKIAARPQRNTNRQVASSGYGQISTQAKVGGGGERLGRTGRVAQRSARPGGITTTQAPKSNTIHNKSRIKQQQHTATTASTEPVKRSGHVRPTPVRRKRTQAAVVAANAKTKTVNKITSSKDATTNAAGGKPVARNGVDDFGGRDDGGEAYKPGGPTGSEAATFDGTHITGDDTMATSKNDGANGPSKTDYKSPFTMEPISGSPATKENHSQPNPQEEIHNNKDELLNNLDATGYDRNTHELEGRCPSGAIPDFIFVCQNWY